ncbi:hypothetical protein XELAEV_18004942mg [Xenopus laevis]|uniref:G-protein coupled receptors family 3 profile domain-containing protein n=1 Tax=Xenopus laevis TaxID=8355 RepID=A0A974I2V1_XENLA|nr:hypothetical protein XELAEV_18004942mg [Xenopus laevis]
MNKLTKKYPIPKSTLTLSSDGRICAVSLRRKIREFRETAKNSRNGAGVSTEPSGSDLQCRIHLTKPKYEYKYFQDGDIIIGGVFTVNYRLKYLPDGPFRSLPICIDPFTKNYGDIITFLFAIDEINSHSDLLPNITLGYHIYDSCADPRLAIGNVLQILSGPWNVIPNFSCGELGEIAGFVGDLHSATSVAIAQLLTIYGYTQISYGATDPALSNRVQYPYYFSTGLNDRTQHIAISKLLEYFGWTWIIILVGANDRGETESQNLRDQIIKHGACVDLIVTIAEDTNINMRTFQRIQHSTAEVIVLSGTPSSPIYNSLKELQQMIEEKTLVIPLTWGSHVFLASSRLFHGSLIFRDPLSPVQGLENQFKEYLSFIQEDMLFKDMLANRFSCWDHDEKKKIVLEQIYQMSLRNCSKQERFQLINLLDEPNIKVYTSVYTVAHALHNMLSAYRKHRNKPIIINKYRKQVKIYRKITSATQRNCNSTRNIQFKDPWGKETSYNDIGEVYRHYLIVNRYILYNLRLIYSNVGKFALSDLGYTLEINTQTIIWKKPSKKILRSQCSENCVPGYRKVPREGAPPCCYDCVPCSEGEISNKSDMENCLKCQDFEWPDPGKTICIEKPTEFLSYNTDSIPLIFTIISLVLFSITTVILGIFILFRNTPVVKANNRNLSFILLVSIKLSFLSVFLFLGHPTDVTCKLRESAFGITFSIAVSCVLAKTIMVYIAFKATKPGSTWRKWVGAKLAQCIALVCSCIQIFISIIWLSVSPPFVELNVLSEPGKIIIQCNEGSTFAFYLVFFYMGFLASMSFIVAFLARTLPDSFNEAKYITFSMLLFCSVWITMIPAYLSTKGKYMVAVEIFAIIASSCGLLFCIFLPKCYIILFTPELNTKQYLLGNTHT